LIYLDSAATSLKPRSVFEAIDVYERNSCANIHRGIHTLAEESTEMYELAREHLATFLGVMPETLIFTHGATESINIVSHGWEPLAHAKASILVDESNHHANIVPRQMLARDKGVRVSFLPVTDTGQLDQQAFHSALGQAPTLIALTHISNVIGTVAPIRELAAAAHAAGAAVLLDCAQSFGHIPLDLGSLGVDFAVGSIHKAYGPFGLGFLWCRPEAFQDLRPLIGGGGMVGRVSPQGFTCADGVAAFEGGTPTISAVAGMRAALDFISGIDLMTLAKHTARITKTAADGLASIRGVSVMGGGALSRTSLVSFSVANRHAHDVAAFLDGNGIAVRAGNHCAMPLHQALGQTASVRASFAAYSTTEDANALLTAIEGLSKRSGNVRAYRNRR
jgi:cysteine desulfurase/selenocysteine lyase